MSSQTGYFRQTIEWAAVSFLVMCAAAIPAKAQRNTAGYVFLVASGFLCDAGDASTCPAVVESAQGDRYEMSGAGVFDPDGKSVIATGTFTHRSADGTAIETGIWIASDLIRFDSYGIAPSALRRQRLAFGPPGFGPGRLLAFADPVPMGGLAVLRIRLLPMQGPSKSVMLEVNCTLGKVPEARSTEGIRLSLEQGGVSFDEEMGGRVMFLFSKQAASSFPKSPASSSETNSAPAEIHP